jgi:hypothetical protein
VLNSINYFAVIRERGENWNASLPMRQQEHWDEHAAFMDALAEEGFIILGGPLGDGERVLLRDFACYGSLLSAGFWTVRERAGFCYAVLN